MVLVSMINRTHESYQTIQSQVPFIIANLSLEVRAVIAAKVSLST